mmetsp:Transcript_9721/g.21011  ORF Transcript_9721/g.21011 Transcript_9721/m.21011 type:complete len:81 (+) Transcript_9721:214-456(+)
MFDNKSRTVDSSCSDRLEYICLCTPLWEWVLDDYDYDNDHFTIKDRIREWNELRKLRVEDKKRERLVRNNRRSSSWKVRL